MAPWEVKGHHTRHEKSVSYHRYDRGGEQHAQTSVKAVRSGLASAVHVRDSDSLSGGGIEPLTIRRVFSVQVVDLTGTYRRSKEVRGGNLYCNPLNINGVETDTYRIHPTKILGDLEIAREMEDRVSLGFRV